VWEGVDAAERRVAKERLAELLTVFVRVIGSLEIFEGGSGELAVGDPGWWQAVFAIVVDLLDLIPKGLEGSGEGVSALDLDV
jgi:hypothetical protein